MEINRKFCSPVQMLSLVRHPHIGFLSLSYPSGLKCILKYKQAGGPQQYRLQPFTTTGNKSLYFDELYVCGVGCQPLHTAPLKNCKLQLCCWKQAAAREEEKKKLCVEPNLKEDDLGVNFSEHLRSIQFSPPLPTCQQMGYLCFSIGWHGCV